VPEEHFKDTEKGILNVDRYASYNVVSDKIDLAYCWYHYPRRLIIREELLYVLKMQQFFSFFLDNHLAQISVFQFRNSGTLFAV
jgi:hypothetical protein